MRRAFTMVEVTLALALFIIISATGVTVGRAVLVHEQEEQFFSQLSGDWDQLREQVRLGNGKGWMTITPHQVRFQAQGTLGNSNYTIQIPDSLRLSPLGVQINGNRATTKLQYKFFGTGAVDSGTVVFHRGNGKLARFVILMQWGVIIRKDT